MSLAALCVIEKDFSPPLIPDNSRDAQPPVDDGTRSYVEIGAGGSLRAPSVLLGRKS